MDMETILDSGVALSAWLQATYPGLLGLMSAVSDLGEFEIYLLAVLFLYWCLDKRAGMHLAYLLGVNYVLVNMGKHFWRGPRPFWLDASLNASETGGYGVPSGHTASAAVAYFYVAYWLKRNWVWALALVGVFLMGLSRIYLGQHFLHDVVAGLLLALSILVGYWVWMRYAHHRFQNQILGRRFWTAVAVPVGLAAVYFLGLLVLGVPNTAVAWGDTIPIAEHETLADMVAALGILLGLGTGFVLEGSRVRFDSAGEWWMRGLRFGLGVVGVFLVLYGLRSLFGATLPADAPLLLEMVLRLIRYFLTAIVGAFYLPMLFVRLGLADRLPPPSIEVVPQRPSPLSGGQKK